MGDGVINNVKPSIFSSTQYSQILESTNKINDAFDVSYLDMMRISNTGPSTDISYPESVENIRINAPKVFASQNRLFSLDDYKTFIMSKFSAYCKDIYMMNNNEYTSKFLKYYYDLGIDAPQKDSRLNIAQVEFMTAVNFNNIYAFLLPRVNTVIDGKIPNYVNTALKQQINIKSDQYKGATHNLVLLDPIYKAFSWASPYIDYSYPSKEQLQTKLCIVRNRNSKYSIEYIKNNVVNNLNVYLRTLTLGSTIDINVISECIKTVGGIESFYMLDVRGNKIDKITLLVWNPLYNAEDCVLYQQNVLNENFVYPYFYDFNNIINTITIIDNE